MPPLVQPALPHLAVIDSDLYLQFARLGKRYRFKGGGVVPLVSNVVLPVTNMDELLRVPKNLSSPGDLTGTAGVYVPIHTVPSGKRWSLKIFQRAGTSASTRPLLRSADVNLPIGAYSTADVTVFMSPLIVMNQGDSVGLEATANAGDGSRYMTIHIEEEDAF